MKKVIFCIGLCLLLLSGCVQTNSSAPEPTSASPTDPTRDLSRPGEEPVAPTLVKQVDQSKIQGKIKEIYPAGGSKVLIFADQITLFDLAAGKTVATTSEEAFATVRCWTLDNGYVIAGQKDLHGSGDNTGLAGGSSSPRFRVIFYDASLRGRSEFDVSRLLRDKGSLISPQSLAFSSDGNRIAYATMTGLYLYNRQQDTNTTLIDLTGEDGNARLGLSIVEQVGFTNGGESIAFKAQSFDVPVVTGKPSFDTLGAIHTDGSRITNQTINGYAVKVLSAYDSQLLVTEDFATADGRVMVMDSQSGDKQIFTLSDPKEGGNIYGSDTGGYFASSVSRKNGWMVRVYDAQTGKLVKEQSISNDGQELYGVNDPVLRVVDEARTCLVLLGNKQDAVETKMIEILF